jgi:multiple sugar transport system permease protein
MTDVAAQSNVASATPDTMAWDSRARRVVMIYLPLACFILILLFPFYWMAVTSFKPNAELLNHKAHNPFWITSPTLAHVKHLLFDTSYPRWLKTTMLVAIGSTFLSLFASTLAAYAIERLRFRGSPYVGLGIYLAYLVPPSILFIPLATVIVQFGLFDSPLALILVYPTFLVPFCTWLLIGYFKSIPYELEECALVDGANLWGYPLQFVRMAISQYAWPRVIGLDGILAATVFPTIGLVAGAPLRFSSWRCPWLLA